MSADALLLARIQFAFTVSFHINTERLGRVRLESK
jgi:hypothetical protein